MENKYYTPDLEIWKDVAGFEDVYQVSNLGRVKRKNSVTRHGRKRKETILKLSNGVYNAVSLCKNNIKKSYTIHRLVATAFIDNPENKEQVNHIDGNKYNNNVNNLEWTTRLENIQHAVRNGLVRDQYGTKNSMHILSEEDVRDIKYKMASGITAYKIHKHYYNNVHQQTIYGIKQGRLWSQITI